MVRIELRDYEAPQTHHTIVEMEESLCGSVNVTNSDKDTGKIVEQDFNNSTEDTWDNGGWIKE